MSSTTGKMGPARAGNRKDETHQTSWGTTMKNVKLSRAQRTAAREGLNRFLSVLLSLAMVLQTSPVAYARMEDEGAAPAAVEQAAPEQEAAPAPEPEPAPAPEPEPEPQVEEQAEPVAETPVAVETPAVDETTDVVAEEPTEAEEPEAMATISVYVENATLTIGGQTLTNAQGTLSTPEGKATSFTVRAADGYELKDDSVKLSLNGKETVLRGNGSYTLSAGQVKNGATITVTPEKVDTETVYKYEDANIRVIATLDKATAIPDDAVLSVTPIYENSRYYNYDAYMDALNDRVSGEDVYDSNNTLLYDVAFLYVDESGKTVEMQPEEGAVTVKFSFKKRQLSEGLEAGSAANVEVNHLPLADSAKADTTYKSTNISADDVCVERMGANATGANTVEVRAKSFSVFAFSYTVDFTYDGYTLKLEGNGSIMLSQILSILNIPVNMADIADVSFSDYDLLSIEKSGSNWKVTSLKSFDTPETLTITMANGDRYVIEVTDPETGDGEEGVEVPTSANLADFLTSVTVSGATLQDGNYVVQQGQTYGMTFAFSETSSLQYNHDGLLEYSLPAGIVIPEDQTKNTTVNIVSGGKTYEVAATLSVTADGKVTFDFEESDPNYHRLLSTPNVRLRAEFDATFDGTVERIHFSDTVTRDVIIDQEDHSDAFVTKSGSFDEKTGVYTYTIKVTASGNPENVEVTDVISGDALIFNNDVQVTGNSTTPVQGTLPSGQSGFKYTFSSMTDGEEITITYSAHLDPRVLANADTITADQTKNTVTVQKDGGNPHNAEYSHEINFKKPSKESNGVVDTTADGDKIYSWTVTYNDLALASAAGDKVRDRIADDSQQYMKFYGNVTVSVYDAAGNLVDTRSVTPDSDGLAWRYEIPTGDTTPYRYVFTYKTIVDKEAVDQSGKDLTLHNTVTGDGGSTVKGVEVGPSEKASIKKEVVSSNTNEITWLATIHVPERGLSEAHVVDTLPRIHTNNLNLEGNREIFDLLKEGSTVEVEGRLPGESYTMEVVENQGLKAIQFDFYKDENNQTPGLQGTPGGHDITIRLTTTVNQEWLEAGYNFPTSYQSEHVNTITLNTTMEAKASVRYVKPDIAKRGSNQGGGVYKYTVYVSDVSESPIVINDNFDTDLLEVDLSKENVDYNKEVFWITGGDAVDHVYVGDGKNSKKVAYTDTADGIQITANQVPMQDNGEYFPVYMITYFLKLKPGVNLDDLAIENGGKFDLENTASWGDHTSSYKFTTTYDALQKEQLTKASAADRYATYKVTFNPSKAKLNNGKPIELTDTMNSHLSIDHTSVEVVTDPPADVVYTFAGEKDKDGNPTGGTIGTYTIPDETSVTITYRAMVIGTGPITYTNVAEANGEREVVSDTVTVNADGGGSGSQVEITAVKVDQYDGSKKLPGAKFKLYASDHRSLFVDENVPSIILETDANGLIVISSDALSTEGHDFVLYEDIKYYLEEVEPPDGYQRLGFPYQFTLTTDDDKVSQKDYIYFSGETLQIKEYPLEGLVIEKVVESEDENDLNTNFNFKITLLTDDGETQQFTGKHGDLDFTDGVANFTLKNNGSVSAWNMPPSTKFKIEETSVEGFNASIKSGDTEQTGNTFVGQTSQNEGQYTLVTFTNTKTEEELGSLTITKKVTVNGQPTTGTLADGTYKFEVTGPSNYKKTVEITVTGGRASTATLSDLEPGTYTVTETDAGGLTVDQASREVTVSGGSTAEVATAEFTNNLNTGDLEVSKQVVSSYDEDKADNNTFNFKVTILGENDEKDTSFAGTFNGVTFSGGEATFTLHHNEKKEIKGLPQGIKYKVEETSRDGFTVDPPSGVITDTLSSSKATADFKNTRKEGSLTITKNFTIGGEASQEANGTFTFLIKDSQNQPAVGFVNGQKITNGEVQVTVTNGVPQSVTITGLKPGQYTVTEKPPLPTNVVIKSAAVDPTASGTVANNIATVTVTADSTATVPTVTFTNNYETVQAQVKKVWSGSDTTPSSLEVKLYKGANADNEEAQVVRTVTLSSANNWQSEVISGLPKYDSAGHEIDYYWTEGSVPAGWFLTNVSKNGIVTTLTNTHQEFELSTSYVGTKTWVGGKPDNLTVKLLADGVDTGLKPTWANTDTNTWTYTFDNLPVFNANGDVIKYTATETLPDGYTMTDSNPTPTSYAEGSAQIVEDVHTCSNLNITLNSKTDLGFVVIKLTENEGFVIWTHRVPKASERAQIESIAESKFKDFSHKAHLYYSGTRHITTKAGTIDVALDTTTNKLTCTFGDTSTWAWLVAGSFGGSHYEPGRTDFENTKKGSLTITKKVTVNGQPTTGTLADGTYKFEVTGPSNYRKTVEITVTGGRASTATLSDLEPGTYTVTETDAGGLTVDQASKTVTVSAGSTAQANVVTFINNKTLGGLTITKKVTVNGAATDTTLADGTYKFEVTGPSNYKETVEITVTGGQASTATLSDLEPGTYTVTETDTGGLTVDQASKTVTVSAGSTAQAATVEFTNNKAIGNLKLQKLVTGSDETDKSFTFEIKLTNADGTNMSGTYPFVKTTNVADAEPVEGTVSVAGKIAVDLKAGETYQINNLPVGTKWTIEEKSKASGYELDSFPNSTGSITTAGATVTATATNKYTASDTTQLEIKKAVEDGTWPTGKKATFKLTGKDNAPMPAEGGDVVEATEANKAYKFGKIAFSQADDGKTYTYTISETSDWNEEGKDFKWEKSEDITATVSVTDNHDGSLDIDVTYTPESANDTITNTYTPDTPDFKKKVKDTNDSTGQTSNWQDSADYDIGDSVPFQLTATLPDDVTSYKQYKIKFEDKMESTLTFGDITGVTVNGTNKSYDLQRTSDGFTLELTWGDGESLISDTSLNGATVEVLFNATLNNGAEIGSRGNINAAKLHFSNSPTSNTMGQTGWDNVIVFTYRMDVSKTDKDGNALPGAVFKLEKKLANGTKIVAENVSGGGDNGNVFSFEGLDDGDYVLTETTAPKGFKPVTVEFTVTADHTVTLGGKAWDETSTPFAVSSPDRTGVLTSLNATNGTGNTDTGDLSDIAGNATTGTVTAKLVDDKLDTPEFEKKIADVNDSEGTLPDDKSQIQDVNWNDSADYDIDDDVPYRLKATLPEDVTSYKQYHITFTDQMEDSLTYNRDARIVVTDKNGNVLASYAGANVETLAEHDQDFQIRLTWGDGNSIISNESLNEANVYVYFTAKLTGDSVKLGSEGNVNGAKLTYSNNASSDGTDDQHEESTDWDYVIAFTYQVNFNKVDQSGNQRTGAEFTLSKVKANNTTEVVATYDNIGTDPVFAFKGLDDGTYVLKETKTPAGYKKASDIYFTVNATHTLIWNADTDEWTTELSGRTGVLTQLNGNLKAGTLDSTDINAGITFERDGGTLTADVINDKATTATIEVTKDFAEWGLADSFTFKLKPVNGAPMPKGTDGNALTEQEKDAKQNAPAKFDAIEYTAEGTYAYTVAEVVPAETDRVAGVTYNSDAHSVVVTVNRSEETGALESTVTYDGNKTSLTVKNDFTSVKKQLEVTKEIDGRDWTDSDSFTFKLEPVGNAPMPKGTNGNTLTELTADATKVNNKVAKFDELEFKAIGAYEYTITEVVPGDAENAAGTKYSEATDAEKAAGGFVLNGVTYDSTAHTAIVDVSSSNGKLAASVTYDSEDSLTVTNEYDAKGTARLFATKTLAVIGADSMALEDGDFTFELYKGDKAEGTPIQSVENGEPNAEGVATAAFNDIEFELADLDGKTSKDFTYTIAEHIPDDAVENGDGTYTLDGMTYDTTTHTVTLTVKDNGDGTLGVTYDGKDTFAGAAFENSYFEVAANVQFNKAFYGISDGPATFKMTPADESGTKLNEVGTTTITGDTAYVHSEDTNLSWTETLKAKETTAVKSPSITFNEAGTYYYLIEETACSNTKDNDESVILAKIVIGEDGTVGDITYQLKPYEDAEFETVSGDDVTFYNNGLVAMAFRSAAMRRANNVAKITAYQPEIRKVLENGDLSKYKFTFNLYQGGTLISTAENDDNGLVQFDAIRYEEPGTYTYTIREVAGSNDTIHYSDEEITLVVEVGTKVSAIDQAVKSVGPIMTTAGTAAASDGDNTAADLVVTSVKYSKDGKELGEDEVPTITNVFKHVRIHAVKYSRGYNADGSIRLDEPLVGAHYGLWMLNPDGNDVYLGSDESDANGNLYYDVPTIEGVVYYFKEEEPPPAGHLVDPYPTDYFTLDIGNEFSLKYFSSYDEAVSYANSANNG